MLHMGFPHEDQPRPSSAIGNVERRSVGSWKFDTLVVVKRIVLSATPGAHPAAYRLPSPRQQAQLATVRYAHRRGRAVELRGHAKSEVCRADPTPT